MMAEQQDAAERLAALEAQVKPHLTRDAITRLGTVKTAHPELAMKAVMVLSQLIQRGQKTVDDDQLKAVLKELGEKKDITIKRR